MTAIITAQDGSGDSTSPQVVDGWDPEAESGNIVHRLIAPGQIAVTLVGDLPRAGRLRLVYADDADAEEARLLLGRPCAFTLEHPGRPVVDMTFVREGTMSPAMHDQARRSWYFTVGFQETP